MNRIQLALNVDDVDAAVAFYSKLFDAEPAKRRPGYANFAISEPPLKLVLLENPGQGGTLNHLGVEVADTDTVDATQTRLAAAGRGVAFLTNNSRATAADILGRLHALGVTSARHALTPLDILGTVLTERCGRSTVLVIGAPEMAAVIAGAGHDLVDVKDAARAGVVAP